MMYKFHIGTIMGSGVIINSVNSVAHLCLPDCVGEVLSIPCMEFFTLFVLFVTCNALWIIQ